MVDSFHPLQEHSTQLIISVEIDSCDYIYFTIMHYNVRSHYLNKHTIFVTPVCGYRTRFHTIYNISIEQTLCLWYNEWPLWNRLTIIVLASSIKISGGVSMATRLSFVVLIYWWYVFCVSCNALWELFCVKSYVLTQNVQNS